MADNSLLGTMEDWNPFKNKTTSPVNADSLNYLNPFNNTTPNIYGNNPNPPAVAQVQSGIALKNATNFLTGEGASNPNPNQYIKPIMDLKFDGLKNAPGFNPGAMNTSPIQTVSPYQMSKELSSAYQPKTNEWANNGITQNQERFDNANKSWQNTRNQLGNVSVGNALLLSMDMNQQRNLMKQSNDQLSNDKRYASSNLENNNSLLGSDLNNRRNNDIASANTNNDINRINMQNSQYGWDRNLETFKANSMVDQNNNANQLKNLEAKLEFNKNIPALQKVQQQQQLLGDLSKSGDTIENRTKFYLRNPEAFKQSVNSNDPKMLSDIEQKYKDEIENSQSMIYNRPEYALNGITNPKAIVSPTANLSIDANGNPTIQYDKLPLNSPLLKQNLKTTPKPVYANSQVDGGVIKQTN